MTELGERDQKLQTKPCWSWSGAEALDFARQTNDLERLVAMLPEKKSSADEILTFVVDLRARFQRWMHQDEFGPTRRQQTAALRALRKSFQTLQRQLAKGALAQREQLDEMLRAGNHLSATVLELPIQWPAGHTVGRIFAAVHESAFGTKRTFHRRFAMSAFRGKADIDWTRRNVRL
jgi:hypothetical protein